MDSSRSTLLKTWSRRTVCPITALTQPNPTTNLSYRIVRTVTFWTPLIRIHNVFTSECCHIAAILDCVWRNARLFWRRSAATRVCMATYLFGSEIWLEMTGQTICSWRSSCRPSTHALPKWRSKVVRNTTILRWTHRLPNHRLFLFWPLCHYFF